uniref:zinc finger CCCH domain-containing protein 18-like n=1 Tax=Callithrix jacchus TaxID=9483 RepID=UPI00159D3DBE|nr:zinc finger CCCH domain-containing protein 18-like [Callithrix jacchus]
MRLRIRFDSRFHSKCLRASEVCVESINKGKKAFGREEVRGVSERERKGGNGAEGDSDRNRDRGREKRDRERETKERRKRHEPFLLNEHARRRLREPSGWGALRLRAQCQDPPELLRTRPRVVSRTASAGAGCRGWSQAPPPARRPRPQSPPPRQPGARGIVGVVVPAAPRSAARRRHRRGAPARLGFGLGLGLGLPRRGLGSGRAAAPRRGAGGVRRSAPSGGGVSWVPAAARAQGPAALDDVTKTSLFKPTAVTFARSGVVGTADLVVHQ